MSKTLNINKRFVRVARGKYALATPEDSLSYRLSGLAAKKWIQEAYLGDGNGDFVPGDGEDDVEFLTEPGCLEPLKASDGYGAVFKVYSSRAVTSPGSLYRDVYKCLRYECEFATRRGFVFCLLPVGTGTRVSAKVMTFLKSFLYKVRILTDADVNTKKAAAAARKRKRRQ